MSPFHPQETIEAVKTKPVEELTDKQRKFLEYQQKLREKWHKRKVGDGKKYLGTGAGAGGGGTGSSLGTVQSSSSAGVLPPSESNDQGEDDDGGFKFASDDDDDDYARSHLDGSPATSGREGRKETGKEINGKFVVESA